MTGLIAQSFSTLQNLSDSPIDHAAIDRPQIVAHATLSAFLHHWPTRALQDFPHLPRILQETLIIREIENSRWIVQRRIAIAKLSRQFNFI